MAICALRVSTKEGQGVAWTVGDGGSEGGGGVVLWPCSRAVHFDLWPDTQPLLAILLRI